MNLGVVFTCCQIAMSVCAAIGYAWAGNVRQTIYHTAAAVIVASVTEFKFK